MERVLLPHDSLSGIQIEVEGLTSSHHDSQIQYFSSILCWVCNVIRGQTTIVLCHFFVKCSLHNHVTKYQNTAAKFLIYKIS